MNNIQAAFENGKAFVAFITCGDPDLETTAVAIRQAVQNGADMIELGIPFSDPTAEGPVIQAANLRALDNGVTTDKIFAMVEELRKEVKIPLLFMTYANVIFSYGTEAFIAKCSDAGINGIIVPDLPYEEKNEFQPACTKYGVKLISVIAPTSANRITMIAKNAEGFIYIASSIGVVGTRQVVYEDLESVVRKVRQNTTLPCVIGFGIADSKQAKALAQLADGVIVGTAIVKLLTEYGKKAPKRIGAYVKLLKQSINL